MAGFRVLLLLLCAGAAFSYYPFVHYTTGTAPFQAAPERFDLKALPGGTLYYFVSGKGPEKLAAGDSFTSVLSQIRQAAKVWNDVETSALRFEFGGLSAPGAVQTTPGVDVLFGEVELPPGLIALGGPTSRSTLISDESGAFVPITRSILVLGKDLSQRPSHSSAFFLTVVHELGHALGLQHTLTSGAMSTEVTRSTTRSRPLSADDIAGISLLYPGATQARRAGSISGRVSLNGVGVHLASVVALEPAGAAVSALTDPEGRFHITGLAPGQYYVYAHALPPGGQPEMGPADIVLPVFPDGSQVPAGPVFETMFYPGASGIQQAGVLTVSAGRDTPDCNFEVRAREPLKLYGVTTYSFPGPVAVKPAFLNVNGTRKFLVAYGRGLITGGAPSPGLNVSVVGGSANVFQDTVAAYAPAPSFLKVDFGFSPFGGEGPRHMVFSLSDDLYVLPAALHLVRSQPPSLSQLVAGTTADGRPAVVVSGSNLVKSTRIMFDGLAAPVVAQDPATGALTVIPPLGAAGHKAVVTALDSDGQESLFLDGANPPVYTYEAGAPPSVFLSPASLAAGSEAMIEITGVNTSFAGGQTIAGFGSSDVVVRRVWVLGPDRLLANVHVSDLAKPRTLPLTVITGFQMALRDSALEIRPAETDAPVVNPVAVNPETGQPSIYAGGKATFFVQRLSSGVAVTLDDLPAQVLAVEEGRVTIALPAGLDLGPAVLRLWTGGRAAAPVVIAIDPAPPVIRAVTDLAGAPLSSDKPAHPGDSLLVSVTGLGDEAELLSLTLGGVAHTPTSVLPSTALEGGHIARFTVAAEVPVGDSVPLIAAIGHRHSQPVPLPVRAAH
ncbi:MAG: matrixin family metalloprotease [Bryobacterales bacterium]|nr:matrixin family metalloprotease [Bryobacterales bacterium]